MEEKTPNWICVKKMSQVLKKYVYRMAQKNDNTLFFKIFQKLSKLWLLYLVYIMTDTLYTFVENFSFVGKKTKERHCF